MMTKNSLIAVFIIFFLCILNYLIGSIPFGVIIGYKKKKVDIRKYGSNSIGATNTVRVLGAKLGILVGLLDILKGMLLILILKLLINYSNLNQNEIFNMITKISFLGRDMIFYPIYSIFAVYGHTYSCFLKFKGGKAVACGAGIMFTLSPLAGIIGAIIFFTSASITKYVSLGSLFTISFLFIYTILFYPFFKINFVIFNLLDLNFWLNNFLLNYFQIITIILLTIIIFIKHIPNIKRLINGTEKSFKQNKKC